MQDYEPRVADSNYNGDALEDNRLSLPDIYGEVNTHHNTSNMANSISHLNNDFDTGFKYVPDTGISTANHTRNKTHQIEMPSTTVSAPTRIRPL